MTVKEIVDIYGEKYSLDSETIIASAKQLAKAKKVVKSSPSLAAQFKRIKDEHSGITAQATFAIFELLGFEVNPREFHTNFWLCEYDFDIPNWLLEPFVLQSDRRLVEYWPIPNVADPDLKPEDLMDTDLDHFIPRISCPKDNDIVAKIVHKGLSSETLSSLREYARHNVKSEIRNKLKGFLTADLNRILHSGSLYRELRFTDVMRHTILQDILKSGEPKNQVWFNRIILQETFPRAFAKCPNPKLDGYEVWQKGHVAANTLCELFGNIRVGSEAAANCCVEIIEFAVGKMNELRRENPKIFQRIVERSQTWPLLKSRHSHFSEDEDQLLAKLGSALSFPMDSSARWNPRDPATGIAIELHNYISLLRLNVSQFLKQKDDKSHWKQVYADHPWIADVKALPDFNSDTARRWWEVGKQFLEMMYPPLSEIESLSIFKSVKSREKQFAAPKKRTDTQLQRDLKKNIRDKFISLAGRSG